MFKKDNEKMSTKKIAILLVTSAFTLVIGYALFLIYITWPISEISINKAGVYGDSFGILTSLFSALAFTGMIITILLQKDELSLQREELTQTRKEISAQKEILRIQNFNNAFYKLLDFYKHNLSQISVTDSDTSEKKEGVGALRFLLSKFTESQSEYKKFYSVHDEEKMKVYEFHLCLDINRILLRQARYLGTFKSIMYLVESQLKSNEEKEIYWKIIESQLTAYEVQYLFYQSLSDIDGEFSKLLNKSKILEERFKFVGLMHAAKVVYERLHGIKLEKNQNINKLPHDRKIITKIKKRLRHKQKI